MKDKPRRGAFVGRFLGGSLDHWRLKYFITAPVKIPTGLQEPTGSIPASWLEFIWLSLHVVSLRFVGLWEDHRAAPGSPGGSRTLNTCFALLPAAESMNIPVI